MTYFGWLDGDETQRASMLEVVKLFEDSSTVDELGIGSVRDTFSNTLFPGTSTLHTRVKYFLFVAWLVDDVARHRWPVERSRTELRSREVGLINSLVAGGERQGVIGRDAKNTLKSMPSELYWASLEHVGVRTWRTSLSGYFRNAVQHARTLDDPDQDATRTERLGMAALPAPPDDLLSKATFHLDSAEAEFLRARITESTRGSLFAWLATNHPQSEADRVWEHEARTDFPEEIAQIVEDARRVHYTASGPALLYNRMMAEVTGNDEARSEFDDRLESWADDLKQHRIFEGWNRSAFWMRMLERNPRIRPGTRKFLDDWWQLAESGHHDSPAAEDLVRNRELTLKRSRARLTNPEARSTWSVGAGAGALDFRWYIAKRHLNDIAEGIGG